MMQRLTDVLERVLFLVGSAALLGSVALAMAAVVMRYGFDFSLEWLEEAARYLALLAAFIVAGPVLRQNGHVALDVFTAGLRGKRREWHRLLVNMVALALGAAIFVWGLALMQQSIAIDLRTASLQFPQWLPQAVVPLGMAFLVWFSLAEALAALKALRTPASPAPAEPEAGASC